MSTIETVTTTAVKITPARPENWVTLVVVGGLHGVMVGGMAFYVLGWKYGLLALAFAAFEAWTLINSAHEDTISEAVWIFSQRPIAVLIMCGSYFWAAASGWLGDPKPVLRGTLFGILLGHFYFSRDNRVFVTSVAALFGHEAKEGHRD